MSHSRTACNVVYWYQWTGLLLLGLISFFKFENKDAMTYNLV